MGGRREKDDDANEIWRSGMIKSDEEDWRERGGGKRV